MPFLRLLAELRVPFLDQIMLFITHFGEETLFMALALLLLWCINKYEGYYVLSVGFIGGSLNQLLKVLFRIPRPWVRDPQFQAVEAAKPGATGYSFPSGHTQISVGTFGAIARWNRAVWLRIGCVALFSLVAFSRMYLGVHTPWDVGVSFAAALILVFAVYPLLRRTVERPQLFRWLLIGMFAWSMLESLFVRFFPFPTSADAALINDAITTNFKMSGAVLGFLIAYELDLRFIRYETAGSFWVQVLKYIPGMALVLVVRKAAKLLFGLLPSENLIGFLVYFSMVLFAGAVWPLAFKYIRKLDKKNA